MGNLEARIPVVDLFAGPGGLGEGFASLTHKTVEPVFRGCLSIEKDIYAHRTLLLRSFFRKFTRGSTPEVYYRYLRREIAPEVLQSQYPEQWQQAEAEVWLAELGKEPHTNVVSRIEKALNGAKNWALIGGPPCQAYSIMGRSRMRSADPEKFEADARHYLYREYLQILADHRPPVFVMENVKGIISSTVGGKRIIQQMLTDLENPERNCNHRHLGGKTHYRIFSLVKSHQGLFHDVFEPADFVIESEKYGIPQTRHRVILLGVREDVGVSPGILKPGKRLIPSARVIVRLPKLRSGLSRRADSNGAWIEVLETLGQERWFQEYRHVQPLVWSHMAAAIDRLTKRRQGTGDEFVPGNTRIDYRPRWYLDSRLGGVCNHKARPHMETDLVRYLFATCFTKAYRRSPELKDFPEALLPNHRNVEIALSSEMFCDRFRVQLGSRPASTITSHMAKDGHYFIHPDPAQCRSLTVREAARLQTFPDNYFFEGSRTQQYRQVGNAVPPLLARQIADVVYNVLLEAELA